MLCIPTNCFRIVPCNRASTTLAAPALILLPDVTRLPDRFDLWVRQRFGPVTDPDSRQLDYVLGALVVLAAMVLSSTWATSENPQSFRCRNQRMGGRAAAAGLLPAWIARSGNGGLGWAMKAPATRPPPIIVHPECRRHGLVRGGSRSRLETTGLLINPESARPFCRWCRSITSSIFVPRLAGPKGGRQRASGLSGSPISPAKRRIFGRNTAL